MMKLNARHTMFLVVSVFTLTAVIGAWGTLSAAPGEKGPPPSPTPLPYSPTIAASKAAADADSAKPRVSGELGDFVVVPPGQGRMLEDCPSGYVFEPNANPTVQRSELYFALPEFKFAGATLCEGRVIFVMAEGHNGAASRGYFTSPGKVKVEYHAPAERIQLLTVGGHPAIAMLPIPGRLSQAAAMRLIQRFPNTSGGSAPGISVTVNAIGKGVDYAKSITEQVLSQGPH